MTEAVADRPMSSRRPIHLWVVGILSLLWNSMGAFDYTASELGLEFYMKQFTPEQIAWFHSFPAWAIAMWAFGGWGAFVGSIGLLLARRWAVWAFAVSLFGLAFNTLYTYVLSGPNPMGKSAGLFTCVIWVIAVALLVYAWRQSKVGVLR